MNIHGDEIKVYELEDKTKSEPSLLEMIPKGRREIAKAYFMQYTESMLIKKITKKDIKEFVIMRYCYRGSVDDWIIIDAGEDLAALAKDNLSILGTEEYFERYPIR